MSGLAPGGLKPITEPYPNVGLCPGNLHFHIGAEHRSEGQYDTQFESGVNGPVYEKPFNPEYTGKRCNYYKDRETNGLDFSPYTFKYCTGVVVGTYFIRFIFDYILHNA